MYKFFLVTVVSTNLLLADSMTQPNQFMEQDVEYIKNKYHIQDEPLQELSKPPGQNSVVSNLENSTSQNQVLSAPNRSEVFQNTNEDKLEKIRRELGIPELKGDAKKLDAIRRELNIDYETPKRESLLDKSVKDVQEALHMDGEIEGEYSFSNSVRQLKKTLSLDGDSTFALPSMGLSDFGLPSLFGEKKKKKKKKGIFGLGSLGNIGIIGDVTDTGQSLYKGMKYSGQSAEMMSGMMYNGSKMYNTMFGMFDDSPLNIFEDEEEEASMFNFMEGGNSIMRMFE